MPLDVAKRGTLDVKDPPLGAIVAANDNYDKGYHEGNPGGLDAIDTDLAPGNIKSGITIFGKLGTLTATLVDDTTGSDPINQGGAGGGCYSGTVSVAAGGNANIASCTPTFDANSRAVAVAVIGCCGSYADSTKLQVIMGGVQVAESGFTPMCNTCQTMIVVGIRALSGAQACIARFHNYKGTGETLYFFTRASGSLCSGGIGVGSVKTT